MLSIGHPMHAYDFDKIAEQMIIIRRGNAGEKLKTLDGETRVIDRDTVVIADGRHAIGLGGVMGGEESEIGPATRNIVLECAWFDPSTIRRTARRLGLKTDASYRFERVVRIDAIRMAASMIDGAPEAEIDVI